MTSTALTRLPEVTSAPSPSEWQALRDQATVIVASGMAPRSVNTAEKVLTIALKGRELRIPPMQALAQIHIVEGKPTLSAELMLALVQRAGHKVRVRETTAERCVVEGVRADDPDYPTTITWTIDDAQRAGVAAKGPWKQYPDAMLRARAISALCRAQFADVLMGASYTPEELGADVDGDGQVISAPAADPELERILVHVDELLDDLADAGVDVDAPAARAYAATSAEHARVTLRNLRGRMPSDDVVDAEIVDDDPAPEVEVDPGPDACTACGEIIAGEHDCPGDPKFDPEPKLDVEAFDWRAYARDAGVQLTKVLVAVRESWPSNSTWDMPNRTKDLDRLADDTMAPVLRATIDDLAGDA